MAQSTPVNPNLPSSNLIPGTYLNINLQGGGAGLNSPLKKLLFLGHRTSGGTAAYDTPIQLLNQKDVNTAFGQGSDVARMYAAAVSQIGPGVVDMFGVPIIEPSGGTTATHLIVVTGPATGAGFISATICGYTATASIANGDSANTIAANLNTAIGNLKDIPCTTGVSTGTITLTYIHKALGGNDLPRIVNWTPGIGVSAGPGTIVFTSSATGAGTTTLNIGGTTITASIANNDTPTIVGASLAAAINATGYPVTATASTGTVTLAYAPDRVVHRIVAAIVTSTVISVATNCGTIATGTPVLTTALTNLQAQQQFPVWCTSFNDGGSGTTFHGGAGSTSSIGTMKTHIALYADGQNQKGQRLVFGSTENLATAGGYQTSTGVQTSSDAGQGRFVEVWQVDSPQQAYEHAARAAAVWVAQDYMPKNYAGVAFQTRGTVPLLGPHRAVRSPTSDQNSALLTYAMVPVVYDDVSNTNRIVRDRTTDVSGDQRIWSWGLIATMDYIRNDLGNFLTVTFAGKSFKPSGVAPRTPNTVTVNSIREACAERYKLYDSIDFIDDVDTLVKGITVQQDAIVPTRVNIFLPVKVPVPFYQPAGNVVLV